MKNKTKQKHPFFLLELYCNLLLVGYQKSKEASKFNTELKNLIQKVKIQRQSSWSRITDRTDFM